MSRKAVEVTAWDIHSAVWERFEGIPPVNENGEICLASIVTAVLDELEKRDVVTVEGSQF